MRYRDLVWLFLILALSVSTASSQKRKAPLPAPKKPALAAPKPVPPVPRTPAERVSFILQDYITQADSRIRGKNPPERMIRLGEGDINAYVQQAVKAKSRFGVNSVYIKFIGPNYLGATTRIDFNKVKVEDQSLAVRMVRSVLSGEKQIYVEGFVNTNNGKGLFRLEKAYFGNLRLPVYFIEKVINYLGSRQNPPIDTSKPVPLPYGLKKIEVLAGAVVLRG
ncbi:MAG TPA: hypothetical protein VGK99_18355 [Acidobacteriota bacterium]